VKTGPSIFEGAIDIFGDDPFLNISLFLQGSNDFDLMSTAALDLILPTGSTFTSDSGVFLTERSQTPVPLPGAIWLLASALGALGVLISQKRGRGASAG